MLGMNLLDVMLSDTIPGQRNGTVIFLVVKKSGLYQERLWWQLGLESPPW